MKWKFKTPREGDIIRIAIGGIYHYGIYISDNEIIQFGPPPIDKKMLLAKDIKVIATDINSFMCGNFLEVGELSIKEKFKARKSKEIVKVARDKIGVGGYNLLYNNCEHFVNECVFGIKKCSQVDEVRAKVLLIPKTDVYYSIIPNEVEYKKVFPESRQKEIDACNNNKIKREKYCVWKLLSYALKKSFNIDIEKDDIHKNNNGKWISSNYKLSLTHNEKYVLVALSNYPIGIDIEDISNIKFNEKLFNKIATKSEANLNYDSKGLAILWTKKESVFKKNDNVNFVPKNIDTTVNKTEIYYLDNDNIVTIACDNFDNINFYSVSNTDENQIEKIKLLKEETKTNVL